MAVDGKGNRRTCDVGTCANVERARAEASGLVSGVAERLGAIEARVEDLRVAMANLPRDVAAMVARERDERAARLHRGEGHFDELFKRLGRLEKQVIALWILLAVVGVGKALALVIPFLKGLAG